MMRKGMIAGMSVCLAMAACSPTKHIPEGDALYTGADVAVGGLQRRALDGIEELLLGWW